MECRHCCFYEVYPSGEKGECRRFPPAPLAPRSLLYALSNLVWFAANEQEVAQQDHFEPEGPGAEIADMSNWPVVHREDWCGEFSAKPSATNQPDIS